MYTLKRQESIVNQMGPPDIRYQGTKVGSYKKIKCRTKTSDAKLFIKLKHMYYVTHTNHKNDCPTSCLRAITDIAYLRIDVV